MTRVKEASVSIGGEVKSSIGHGLLVFLGVKNFDTEEEAKWVADRICGLRIFEDTAGKMNVNPTDAGAEILVVSQFTLYADISSRRPGFIDAARPDVAIPLYELVIEECRSRGFRVETGEFGADMQVLSINDGPLTIIIER